jgi:membrane fusion protein, hemolysin D
MSLITSPNETKQAMPTPRAVTPAAKVSQPAPKSVQLTAADREFLPASLEILVTPPSPIARALLLTICGLFFLALAWSYFGWIDIYAVAPGKIQPIGGSKVVQPLEPGIITAIYVENGSHVNAGDVLLALDPTETVADREAQARDLEAASAEASRRKVAIAAAHTETLEPLPIESATNISDPVRRREQGVLSADLGQLRSSIANFKAQLAEKLATKQRLTTTIAAREKLIALARERVAMRQRLDDMGSGARAQTIESLEQLETQVTTDTGDRGQLIETDAAMRSLERKGEEAITQFIADQSQKLAEVERKRDHLEQDLIKAQSKADRTELRAPITGTVQQLAVSSIGQVVASGQSLLTIVPVGGSIEVQAMIENQDIGFVEVGQPAVIKTDAFPFTRYGTINGVVEKVSRDAVDQRDATVLSDAANAAKSQSSAPGSPIKPQDLVFPATIQLTQRSINIDGKEVALIPGMGVSVEIKTGRRRAIDYLLSPLREIGSRAGSER